MQIHLEIIFHQSNYQVRAINSYRPLKSSGFNIPDSILIRFCDIADWNDLSSEAYDKLFRHLKVFKKQLTDDLTSISGTTQLPGGFFPEARMFAIPATEANLFIEKLESAMTWCQTAFNIHLHINKLNLIALLDSLSDKNYLSQEKIAELSLLTSKASMGTSGVNVSDSLYPADKISNQQKKIAYLFNINGYEYTIERNRPINEVEQSYLRRILTYFPNASKEDWQTAFLDNWEIGYPPLLLKIATTAFDQHGNTCLGIAAEDGKSIDAMNKLIAMGADSTIIAYQNKSIEEYARERGFMTAAQIINTHCATTQSNAAEGIVRFSGIYSPLRKDSSNSEVVTANKNLAI